MFWFVINRTILICINESFIETDGHTGKPKLKKSFAFKEYGEQLNLNVVQGEGILTEKSRTLETK